MSKPSKTWSKTGTTPIPGRRSTYFRDGVSRIDFVLVQNRVKSEAQRLQNFRFLSNLRAVGVRVEREAGVKYDDLIFIKLHASDALLKDIANFRGVVLTFENDQTIPIYSDKLLFFKTKISLRPDLQDPIFQRCTPIVRGEKTTTFTTAERIMLLHFLLIRTKFGELEYEYGINRMLFQKNFEDAYPLHDGKHEWDEFGHLNDRQILSKYWANPWLFYKMQPLHVIQKYYGPEIGLYYTFYGFYNKMIVPAAIFGTAIFIYGQIVAYIFPGLSITETCDSKTTLCPSCVSSRCKYGTLDTYCSDARHSFIVDNRGTVFVAICLTIWATLFRSLWLREENVCLYKWNLMNMTPEIDEMPEFQEKTKTWKINPYTGKKELYVPTKQRVQSYIISAIIISLCILFVIVTVLLVKLIINITKQGVSTLNNKEFVRIVNNRLIRPIDAIINMTLIMIYSPYIHRIAHNLTEWENYRHREQFLNSFIFKSYLLAFFNSYTMLFYTAFFQEIAYTHPGNDEEHISVYNLFCENCPPVAGCVNKLSIALLFTLGWKSLTIKALKIAIPYVCRKVKKCWRFIIRKKRNLPPPKHMQKLPQWEADYELLKMDKLFFLSGFRDVIIQFGVVVFFTGGHALTPVLVLINNIIALRTSAIAFTKKFKRNIPRRVSGLGAWDGILHAKIHISFMIAGLLLAFSLRIVPRTVYEFETGTLQNYSFSRLTAFSVKDFSPERRDSLLKRFPNISICYFAAQKNPYDHPKKYENTDHYYKGLAYRLGAVVAFYHLVYTIHGILALVINEKPSWVAEKIAYEERKIYAARMAKLNEEVKNFLFSEHYH